MTSCLAYCGIRHNPDQEEVLFGAGATDRAGARSRPLRDGDQALRGAVEHLHIYTVANIHPLKKRLLEVQANSACLRSSCRARLLHLPLDLSLGHVPFESLGNRWDIREGGSLCPLVCSAELLCPFRVPTHHPLSCQIQRC